MLQIAETLESIPKYETSSNTTQNSAIQPSPATNQYQQISFLQRTFSKIIVLLQQLAPFFLDQYFKKCTIYIHQKRLFSTSFRFAHLQNSNHRYYRLHHRQIPNILTKDFLLFLENRRSRSHSEN